MTGPSPSVQTTGDIGAVGAAGPAWDIVQAALLSACVAVAGVDAISDFAVPGAPAVLVASAVGGVGIVFACTRLARSAAATAYAASAAGLIVVLLAAVGPHPDPVAGAFWRVPNRLLTETLPLGGDRALLSPLVAVVWLVGALAAELLFRGDRRSWSIPSVLGLPVLLYLLSYTMATGAPGRHRAAGPLLLALIAALASAHHYSSSPRPRPSDAWRVPGAPDDPGTPPPWRGPLGATLLAVALAAVLTALAPTVPALAGPPDSLHRRPTIELPTITDPLGAMAILRDADPGAPPRPELTAQVSGPWSGYLAMGYLDAYDGGQWRFSATFQPTGGRVPGGVPAGARSGADPALRQRILVDPGLPVPLLPAVDRPTSVTGRPVVADPATGMLLPGTAGPVSYTVVSIGPALTLLRLPAADGIDRTQASAADTALPPDTGADVATTLRYLSTLTGRRPQPSLAFLQSALEALHATERRVKPSAVPARSRRDRSVTTPPPVNFEGTSLAQVINAVTVNRAATPEQFATFYAVIARYLGVPARVVTGFRLVASSSASGLGPGHYEATNREAWAWVEVPISGLGWVVADPSPDATTASPNAPPEAASASPTTLPRRAPNALPHNRGATHGLARPTRHPARHRDRLPPWALAVLAGAAAAVLAAGAGPGQAALRRHRRRRRRRSGDPPELAVGAWLELLDCAGRAGMIAAPGATNREVATEVGNHFGPDAVTDAAALAAVADRAIFSNTVAVDIESARQAWATSLRLSRRILGGLDARQRVRAALLVGSSPARPGAPRGGSFPHRGEALGPRHRSRRPAARLRAASGDRRGSFRHRLPGGGDGHRTAGGAQDPEGRHHPRPPDRDLPPGDPGSRRGQ